MSKISTTLVTDGTGLKLTPVLSTAVMALPITPEQKTSVQAVVDSEVAKSHRDAGADSLLRSRMWVVINSQGTPAAKEAYVAGLEATQAAK